MIKTLMFPLMASKDGQQNRKENLRVSFSNETFFPTLYIRYFLYRRGRKKNRLIFIANSFTYLIFTIYVILADEMAWYTDVTTDDDVFYIQNTVLSLILGLNPMSPSWDMNTAKGQRD